MRRADALNTPWLIDKQTAGPNEASVTAQSFICFLSSLIRLTMKYDSSSHEAQCSVEYFMTGCALIPSCVHCPQSLLKHMHARPASLFSGTETTLPAQKILHDCYISRRFILGQWSSREARNLVEGENAISGSPPCARTRSQSCAAGRPKGEP